MHIRPSILNGLFAELACLLNILRLPTIYRKGRGEDCDTVPVKFCKTDGAFWEKLLTAVHSYQEPFPDFPITRCDEIQFAQPHLAFLIG